MRLFNYKCTESSMCSYPWGMGEDDKHCVSCGMSYEEAETVWDKIGTLYYKTVPYGWRPKNFWYRVKCRYWKRWTTVKPRKLDHTWCDRDHLLIHVVFEVLCQFVEGEMLAHQVTTPEEWEWQREANPDFYASWKEAKELYDWWMNEYDEDYPWGLSEEERQQLEKLYGKSCIYIEQDCKAMVRAKCKRVIDISPWFWT